MCFPPTAEAPALTPVPVKQPVKAPDANDNGSAAADQLRRRVGLASLILPQSTPGATTGTSATATGKTTLGG